MAFVGMEYFGTSYLILITFKKKLCCQFKDEMTN